MGIEILVDRIKLIKGIKDALGTGLIEANKKYQEILEFAESKQEVDFYKTDRDLYWLMSELRRNYLLGYHTQGELESDETKERQRLFILKHNEAIIWKMGLTNKEHEHLETLIQASQIICSAE